MNIAVICNSYPTKKNPRNQVFIKKLCDELVEKKMNVSVCYNKVFNFWGNANEIKNPIANSIKYTFYLLSVLTFWLRNNKKTDILFPQGIIIATLVSVILKKISGTPVLCYIHGGDLNLFYNKKGVMHSILKYSLDNSDYIIANSQDIYKKAIQVTDNPNICIISPGIDLKVMHLLQIDERKNIKKKYGIPNNKIIFLAAGTAIKRKGFDVLLEALTKINKKTLRMTHFTILSDGPEQKNYIEYIKNNNLNDFVCIKDRVNQVELNQYYNISDFFVFPSREEPLGLVGLEAMASNTVVIGSNLGGIKEFVIPKETGFLFEKENSDELAGIIDYVVHSEKKFEEFYPKIEHTVNKHSLSKSADQLVNLFEKIKLNSN